MVFDPFGFLRRDFERIFKSLRPERDYCLRLKQTMDSIASSLNDQNFSDFQSLLNKLDIVVNFALPGTKPFEKVVGEMERSKQEKGYWDPAREDTFRAEIGNLEMVLEEWLEEEPGRPYLQERIKAANAARWIGTEAYVLCIRPFPLSEA